MSEMYRPPAFGSEPLSCPKCGQSWIDPRDLYVEFHASPSPYSCYERGDRHIQGDHLKWRCSRCDYAFHTLPKDAA